MSTDHDDRSGRHQVNIGHLVMGLAFVGLVGVWALIQGDVVDGADIRWLLPVPWVLAGIAGLLATTLTNRDRWGARQTGWVGTAIPNPTHDSGDSGDSGDSNHDTGVDDDTRTIPTHEEYR